MTSAHRHAAASSLKAINRILPQNTRSISSAPSLIRCRSNESAFRLLPVGLCSPSGRRPNFSIFYDSISVSCHWRHNFRPALISPSIYQKRSFASSSDKNEGGSKEDCDTIKPKCAIDDDTPHTATADPSTHGDVSHSDDDNTTSTTTKKAVRFPWRHETQPLPRILERDDLSAMPNNFRARFLRKTIASRELGATFWEMIPIPFYTHEWELELGENFSVAFGLALEELLRVMVKAPVKNEGGVISIDTSQRASEDGGDDVTDSSTDFYDDKDDILTKMMDKALLQKFESLDLEHMQLKLSIRPMESTLQHIFAIPLITRDIVEQKPHLRGGYQRIEQRFQETKSYEEVRNMTMKITEDIGMSYKRTVVADALVTCSEFFQVVDSRDGRIVQGMRDGDEEEIVDHVVRFEVVTDITESGEGREVGNWKIIDLDDMLDGNVFH